MKRRAFIAGLGSAAAWPLVARGQQPTMPVVGFISPRTYEADLAAFRRGLNEAGYIEGKNVTVDIRWLEGKSDLAPSIVTDLVARQVSAIASTTAGALAAKGKTSTIPIVFATGGDPVELGLVSSLNRPDGNLTGVTFLAPLMESKRLELIHEMAPQASVIAVLLDPNGPIASTQTKEVPEAARALGLRLAVQHASADAISTLLSRPSQKRGLVRSSSQPLRFSTSRMKKSSLRRYAMCFLRFTGGVRLPKLPG